MEEHKLVEGELLDVNGNLLEAGYAFSLVRKYDRTKIKARKMRIKEWDYYYIGDEHYGIALTIADNSYMGLGALSILNFENKTFINKPYMFWFPKGKTRLPSTSQNGDVGIKGKGYSFMFINNHGKRHLVVKLDEVEKGKSFECDIKLEQTTPHSMVIATPFKKSKHFYYNQKINLLRAQGGFKYGNIKHEFGLDTYGVLDWGRGVWTYKNTWYWSSLNTLCDGHRIGWNLGYGFGDTKASSENMIFYDDKVYKIKDIVFDIPKDRNGKDDFLKDWKLVSSDKKVNITFHPVIDRKDCTNAIIISQAAHQVFGYFSGEIDVGDEKIIFKKCLGFAEKVKNRW